MAEVVFQPRLWVDVKEKTMVEEKYRQASLLGRIKGHSRDYVSGEPTLSDAGYDALVREYNESKGDGVGLVEPPVVGAQPMTGDTIMFPRPLLSLANAFSVADRREAVARMVRRLAGADGVFAMEPKVDGMAFALFYGLGSLVGAATRGDGFEGDNVYAAAEFLEGVPLTVSDRSEFVVVGEAYMLRSDLALLNTERAELGLDEYASPRNTTVGAIMNSDPTEVGKRRVRFIAYDVLDHERDFGSASERLEFCRGQNFVVVEQLLVEPEDVEDAFGLAESRFEGEDMPCDGIVFKLNSVASREALGEGSTSPNWAFAAKLTESAEWTTLLGVDFSTGRTGRITPVASLESVVVGDVSISSVTLHNRSIVEGLGIMIGDRVLVKRAGDVIPAIVEVDLDARPDDAKPIVFPTECPVCGSTLNVVGGVGSCVAQDCVGTFERRLEHFVDKDYMDIRGVGPSTLSYMVRRGLVHTVADLYSLRLSDLEGLEGFGRQKAKNIVDSITASKERTLSRLLPALGIHEVGRTASRVLALKCRSMEEVLTIRYEDLLRLEGFGDVMARSVVDYFANSRNVDVIRQLARAGVNMIEPGVDSSADGLSLSGLGVCVTGKLERATRAGMKEIIEMNGGTFQTSVSRKTDMLVFGERAGSKLAKARSMHIDVIDEGAFLDMVGD